MFVDYHNSRVAKTKYVVLLVECQPPFEILCVLSLNIEKTFFAAPGPLSPNFLFPPGLMNFKSQLLVSMFEPLFLVHCTKGKILIFNISNFVSARISKSNF